MLLLLRCAIASLLPSVATRLLTIAMLSSVAALLPVALLSIALLRRRRACTPVRAALHNEHGADVPGGGAY